MDLEKLLTYVAQYLDSRLDLNRTFLPDIKKKLEEVEASYGYEVGDEAEVLYFAIVAGLEDVSTSLSELGVIAPEDIDTLIEALKKHLPNWLNSHLHVSHSREDYDRAYLLIFHEWTRPSWRDK